MAEGIGLLNQRAMKCTMGSNPISSESFISIFFSLKGSVVQLAERMLCKHEVIGSSPIISKSLFFSKKIQFYVFSTHSFF